jgi:hypothetical protein
MRIRSIFRNTGATSQSFLFGCVEIRMTQPSSLLFSLQELARMEDERLRAQAEAVRRADAEAARARQEEEATARRAEEERARAEADARADAERRARDEAAHREGLARAASEAARVSVEARARAEERERERRHELELVQARSRARRGAWKRSIAAAIAGAACALGASAGTYQAWAAPREAARASQARADLAACAQTATDARAKVDGLTDQAATLSAELATARSENRSLKADLDDARRQLARAHNRGAPPPKPPPRDELPRIDLPTCAPGSLDPMCLH